MLVLCLGLCVFVTPDRNCTWPAFGAGCTEVPLIERGCKHNSVIPSLAHWYPIDCVTAVSVILSPASFIFLEGMRPTASVQPLEHVIEKWQPPSVTLQPAASLAKEARLSDA